MKQHRQQQQPSNFCQIKIRNLLRLLAPHQPGNLLPGSDIQEFVIHYWRKVRSSEFIKGRFTPKAYSHLPLTTAFAFSKIIEAVGTKWKHKE